MLDLVQQTFQAVHNAIASIISCFSATALHMKVLLTNFTLETSTTVVLHSRSEGSTVIMEYFTHDRPPSSTEANSGALKLNMALAQFGLGPYQRQLCENGFSNGEGIIEIIESGMSEM